ncbi:MAG TPA: NTP transferase domain-containing protein [Kofleriaceae bacterium]|nr:NTP transferase domain-containing protein [Kofleriaceae bacterium]
MRFGPLPVDQALGAILVHTTRANDVVLKKGRVLRLEDLAALTAAKIDQMICAVLEAGDVHEDRAAHALAMAVAGPGCTLEPAKTGRCNVMASEAGLCLVDPALLTRLNSLDERITVASLAPGSPVRAGEMVATVKIIPFCVPAEVLAAAVALARAGAGAGASAAAGAGAAPRAEPSAEPRPGNTTSDTAPSIDELLLLSVTDKYSDILHISHSDDDLRKDPAMSTHDVRITDVDHIHSTDVRMADTKSLLAQTSAAAPAVCVRRWLGRRAGLILTRFADTRGELLQRAATAQRTRLQRCGGQLAEERVVAHEPAEVAAALQDLARAGLDPILVLGASAIMDRQDVIPTAVAQAQGQVLRLGMPVDPGNLLMLARLGPDAKGPVVLGVPGCARSLKRSGFDWVLERCCAGLEVTSAQIAALGAGGLLEEVERPAPRAGQRDDADSPRPSVAAVVLAAGRSARMGSAKLLEDLEGKPLVRWAVEAALASAAHPVVVVTGHRGDEVAAALAGLDVVVAPNPEYQEGLASSLRAGLARALAELPGCDGVLVCLGDMPRVTSDQLDRLLAAFDAELAPIVVPTHERKRGNPVLWARRYFTELASLRGDVGARGLLDRHAEQICLVPMDDPAILLDVDTPQALAALRLSSLPLSAKD